MVRRLTPKQKAYVKMIAAGATKRDAVKAAYNVTNPTNSTASNLAQAVERSPAVLAVLEKMNIKAQQSIEQVMDASVAFAKQGDKEGAMYAGVAVQAANSVLDRLHGKAKQSIDVTSKSVNINVDLS